eukprot:2862882-Prymnesium_polylepis.1
MLRSLPRPIRPPALPALPPPRLRGKRTPHPPSCAPCTPPFRLSGTRAPFERHASLPRTAARPIARAREEAALARHSACLPRPRLRAGGQGLWRQERP